MQVKNHGKYSQSLEAIKTRTMKNKEALLSYWDNFNTELYYKYLKARQK